jgi:hypothetical protein
MLSTRSNDRQFSSSSLVCVAFAESECQFGLHRTQQQIDEMMQDIDPIKYQMTLTDEREVRHHVVTHLDAFGKQRFNAWKGIGIGFMIGTEIEIEIGRER